MVLNEGVEGNCVGGGGWRPLADLRWGGVSTQLGIVFKFLNPETGFQKNNVFPVVYFSSEAEKVS